MRGVVTAAPRSVKGASSHDRHPDIARWLHDRSGFDPELGRLEWGWEEAFPSLHPEDFAARLCDCAATSSGRTAALALEAITDVLWWVSEIRQDVHARPNVEGTGPWLESFTDEVLRRAAFVRDCTLAYTPPVPVAEQAYVDARVARLVGGTTPVTDVEGLALDIAYTLEDRAASPDLEELWWAVRGGTVGTARRLVRCAEIASFLDQDHARKHHVVELRAVLVDSTRDPLAGARLPFWSRAWLVQHVAPLEPQLVEDLVSREPVAWLAGHMRYLLGLSKRDRQERWRSWLT